MLDGATLEQLAAYGGGGVSMATAYWINAQALKRAGLLPARWLPVANLISAGALVGAWYYSIATFNLAAGTLILAALFTLAHGGAKAIAAPDRKPDI